jgi:hypothetical protein
MSPLGQSGHSQNVAVNPLTPLALVRRPIASPLKHMPLKALARGSGMPVPARASEAICVSPTSISIAATATKRRARPRSRQPLHGPPPAAELAKAGELFCVNAVLKIPFTSSPAERGFSLRHDPPGTTQAAGTFR